MSYENKISDEDKMIKKLKEHRNAKNMVIEIGRANGIKVTATEGNDTKGDFYYDSEDNDKLVKCLDQYLSDYKYVKGSKENE